MKESSTPVAPSEQTLVVTRTLKNPSRGEDVSLLQTRLQQRGYLTTKQIDGIFLSITEEAVKKFQADNALTVDGIAGAITLEKLNMRVEKITVPPQTPHEKGTVGWYEEMFAKLTYDAGYETKIQNAAKRCIANFNRYAEVAKQIWPNFKMIPGKQIEPWMFVAGLHNMEASGNFAGVLHNGEKIIGTGKKTSLVPAGRGPFKTWEDSAIDVLKNLKNLDKITDWSIGNILKQAEIYNGTGYLKYHPNENTPYLWAMSNINDGKGKYTSDGKYSETADANGQVGFATLCCEILLQLSPTQKTPVPVEVGNFETQVMKKNSSLDRRMVHKTALALEKYKEVISNDSYALMINFGLNETNARLYVLDLKTMDVVYARQVAHGSNSDPDKDGLPTKFSNINGSHQSSLGPVLIGNMFSNPKWKFCRLLMGLDPVLNGLIRKREIIMHTSTYVKDDFGKPIGDSWGCPAISEKTGKDIMGIIGGALLYIWAPELEA